MKYFKGKKHVYYTMVTNSVFVHVVEKHHFTTVKQNSNVKHNNNNASTTDARHKDRQTDRQIDR